jgi:hypothetical protein
MGWLKRKQDRKPAQPERQPAKSAPETAQVRVQPEPPAIYNPDRGARWHFRDPSFPAAHPVCGASGAGWAEGNGGLKPCGLCPGIWAQRQGRSEAGAA